MACRPQLDMSARRDAIRTAFSRTIRRLCDQTIADWLDITPTESRMLERLPAASRFGVVKAEAQQVPSVNADQRRRLISQLVTEFGVLSCRAMAKLLAQSGCVVSQMSVSRDYRALNLPKERES
jgi:hypothetical protein